MFSNTQLHGDLEDAKEELGTWKTKAEKADDAKSRLIMEKLEADELKEQAKKQMLDLAEKLEGNQKDFTKNFSAVKDEIRKLVEKKQGILDTLRRHLTEFDDRRAKAAKLKEKFKIYAQIADTEMKFISQHKEESTDDSQPIKGIFALSQKANMLLQGGQALITFEEEKVASQILRIAKCSVSCENVTVDVNPKRIKLDPGVKFEVHLDVSRKELKIFNIHTLMPEDRIKDRLEMSFSRPSRGGGEVERVEYDKNTEAGCILFLHPGVAGNLTLRGKQHVDFGSEATVQVGPSYEFRLCKFQTFCGVLKRTILLDNIKDIEEEEDLQDHLEIHFQKPSNFGGEIDSIKYISSENAQQAFFSEDMVMRGNSL